MSRYLFASMLALSAMPAFAKANDQGAAAAAPGADLVDQAQASADPPVELPAEVVAQLETAATNLEDARRQLGEANTEVERLTGEVTSQTTVIEDLRRQLADADRAYDAMRASSFAVVGEPLRAMSAPAVVAGPIPAPEVDPADLVARVTVNRGVVVNSRAEGGEARAGESFPATAAEADTFRGLHDRGFVTVEAV